MFHENNSTRKWLYVDSLPSFFLNGSTLIQARIRNFFYYKVWDEITFHTQTSTVTLLKFWNR